MSAMVMEMVTIILVMVMKSVMAMMMMTIMSPKVIEMPMMTA